MMGGAAALTLTVLSGLCLLPAASPRKFILVQKLKSWSSAQEYCRDRYTDLATVTNQQDLDEVNNLIEDRATVWIGLHYDESDVWRWSLENPEFYGEGEKEFRFKTLVFVYHYKNCITVSPSGSWHSSSCDSKQQFVCYNGTQDSATIWVLVQKCLSWDEAQSYCRTHYIDLVSVRNETENQRLTNMTQGKEYLWIGLYGHPWTWSDGSRGSFSNWNNTHYVAHRQESCVAATLQTWDDRVCEAEYFFMCHYDQPPKMRTQRVRVVLKTSDSSVDMEDLNEDILLKLQQQLKARGVKEDVKLKWVKQPDGKVFQKMEERKKKKREHCDL